MVAAVFSKTSSLGIKIRGLEAFVIFCGGSLDATDEVGDGLNGAPVGANANQPNPSSILDKYTVQEKLVPLLKAIKTREPSVMMASLEVFKQVGKIADAEFLAMDVLPLLWSFSLGPLLNLEQFKEFMTLIKSLSFKIEREQTKKLRELSSNSNNGTSAASRSNDLMGASNGNGAYDSNILGDMGETDFERLVLGKSSGSGDTVLGESLRPQPQRAQSAKVEAPAFSWSTPALAPAPNPTLSLTPALTPSSNNNFRAITPDQTLDSFATLKPNVKAANSSSNGILAGFNALTPMQPSNPWSSNNATTMQPSSPWSSNLTPMSPQPQQFQPQSNFFLPPPPTSHTTFHGFSIPPPAQSQRWNAQPNYSGNLRTAGQVAPVSATSKQPPKQNSGLDTYESLL